MSQFLVLATHSFNPDYISVPADTEDDAKNIIKTLLEDKIAEAQKKSSYTPVIKRHSDTDICLAYEKSEDEIDANTDFVYFKAFKTYHGISETLLAKLGKA